MDAFQTTESNILNAYLFFKCINNLSSEFYADIFKPISEIHGRDTRSSSNNTLAIPKCRTEYYNHALRCSGSVLWNDLPTEFNKHVL